MNVVYKEVLLKSVTAEAEPTTHPADTDLASMMTDVMDNWMESDGLLDDLPEDLVDQEEFGTPQPGFINQLV